MRIVVQSIGQSTIWANPAMTLYHGTIAASAQAIVTRGVDLLHSRKYLDFGEGFYLTTSLHQARAWAAQKSLRLGDQPRVCQFDLDRDQLAHLEALCFVRADIDATDFWAFVRSCRIGLRGHGRDRWYDIVIGPVVLGYRQRLEVMPNSDQLSFHTGKAVGLLNNAVKTVLEI